MSASPAFDRAAIMRDAHRLYRQMGPDWDWPRCLRYAWNKARGQRERRVLPIRAAPAPARAFDRAAIMRDADRLYRDMGPHGWDWPRCLRYAWAKARGKRELRMVQMRAAA